MRFNFLQNIKLILVLIFMPSFLALGQVNSDFNVPVQACINELISLENLSSANAQTYEWEFCPGDIEAVPTIANILEDGLFDRTFAIDYMQVDSTWVAFVPSRANDELLRLDYGNDPNNTPNIINLGNIGNLLDGPVSIDFMKEGNDWFAFIVNLDDGELLRLEFGDDILSTPTITALGGVLGTFSNPDAVELIRDNAEFKAIVLAGSIVHVVNFGSSYRNDPSMTSFTIPGTTRLWDISLIKSGNNWYGMATDFSGGDVYHLDFGTNVTSSATVTQINLMGNAIGSPADIQLVREGTEFYAINIARSGILYRFDFGTDISSTSPLINTIGNLGQIAAEAAGLSLIRFGTGWQALVSNFRENEIYRLDFSIPCLTELGYSEEFEPQGLRYSSNGSQQITLTVFDENGNNDTNAQVIDIIASEAPDIALTSQNVCVSSPISFMSQNSSNNLTSYSWDFGDGSISTDTNPDHSYMAPGDYNVTLSVVSSDGCSNSTNQTITIFPEPQPSFDFPAGPVCTNQSTFVENTTPGDFEGNISYEWQLNGQPVAFTEDLENLIFVTPGDQELKLIASIPGCSVEIVENITNVSVGATPEFTVDDACVGTLMQFSNTSTGDISSTSWDFGNGFTSTLENPAFEYSEPGTYEVTLSLLNNDGCLSEITESVTVYQSPQVQFTNELSCEGSPTQFIDQTTIGDANIISWSWDFDDEASSENTSTARDPLHTFSTSGDFDVKLVTTTTFGCVDSVERAISVLPAPEVDFTFDRICIGEPVQFQDLSTAPDNSEITTWAWDLGGVFSDLQNPEFTFDVAADYRIGLVVTADNLCTSFTEKIITVAPVPNVSFGQEFTCDNEPAKLYDLTSVVNDEIVEWNWDFDGLGESSDSSTFFQFPSAGDYTVELSITTANGCDYSTIQTVTINPAPEASFTSDFNFGSPPLDVQFTNTSNGAISFQWDFQNGSTSTEENPRQVFDELGEYDISLVTTDTNGCRDTVEQRVTVLFPSLDVDLQSVALIQNLETTNVVLTINNNGTILLDSLNATIDLGNQIILNESINRTLVPGQTINHTLNLSIAQNSLDYICITVNSFIDDFDDVNPNNNDQCTGLESNVLILNPYPNPANDVINISIISESSLTANLQLVSSQGAVVRNILVGLNQGFNRIVLNVADLNSGIYILSSEVGGTTSASRVMINN